MNKEDHKRLCEVVDNEVEGSDDCPEWTKVIAVKSWVFQGLTQSCGTLCWYSARAALL